MLLLHRMHHIAVPEHAVPGSHLRDGRHALAQAQVGVQLGLGARADEAPVAGDDAGEVGG